MNRLKVNFMIILSALVLAISCDQIEDEIVNLSNFQFSEMSVAQLRRGLDSGTFSVTELVSAYLNRIDALDRNGPGLNAVISVNPDALEIAEKLEQELKAGDKRSLLHGIPVILKDNIDSKDRMPTTAGATALKNWYPQKDSWVAAKLREAGAVILGKANLSEWANFRSNISSSGWSGVGGQTNNPFVLDCNPCGSSSGSAVAVSANLCALAIGTETNGSIVCPSNANGIVGIKPTVGLVSRTGIIPISKTQDTAGPMARTVADAAACLSVIAGIDPGDPATTVPVEYRIRNFTQFLKADGLKGKRIGIYKQSMGFHHRVDALFDSAGEFLKSQGAELIEIDRILAEGVENASFMVMLFEFKDGLNRYLTGVDKDLPVHSLAELIAFNEKDPVELGSWDQKLLEMAQEKGDLDSPEYLEALEKILIGARQEGIDRVMDEYNLDAIIAPTGSPAWKTDPVNGDHFLGGSSSPAAISGYPNITVPMGFIDGLPVGMSFFGRAWSESVLIEIAFAYEQGTLHRKSPEFLLKY